MIQDNLEKIGFTKNESRVLASLNTQPEYGDFPSNIAKSSGLNRYTTYDVLDRLYRHGIILKLNKNGKLWYQAQSPEDILNWLSEKQKRLKQQIVAAESLVIPELLKQRTQSLSKPSIQVFEGRKGIFNLAKETISWSGNEILYLSSARTVLESFSTKVLQQHITQKRKRRIFSKLIFPKREQEKVVEYIQQIYLATGNLLFECRLFDFKTISNELMITADSVAITNIASPHPFVVHIQSKEVTESYRELFLGIWKKSKSLIVSK